MNKQTKSALIRYGVSFLIAAAITTFWMLTYWGLGYYGTTAGFAKITCWTNAVVFPGVMYLMVGSFIWLNSMRAFDSLGYVVGKAIHALIPTPKHIALRGESYQEYLARKHPDVDDEDGELKKKTYGHIWLVGTLFFVAGAIMSCVANFS